MIRFELFPPPSSELATRADTERMTAVASRTRAVIVAVAVAVFGLGGLAVTDAQLL